MKTKLITFVNAVKTMIKNIFTAVSTFFFGSKEETFVEVVTSECFEAEEEIIEEVVVEEVFEAVKPGFELMVVEQPKPHSDFIYTYMLDYKGPTLQDLAANAHDEIMGYLDSDIIPRVLMDACLHDIATEMRTKYFSERRSPICRGDAGWEATIRNLVSSLLPEDMFDIAVFHWEVANEFTAPPVRFVPVQKGFELVVRESSFADTADRAATEIAIWDNGPTVEHLEWMFGKVARSYHKEEIRKLIARAYVFKHVNARFPKYDFSTEGVSDASWLEIESSIEFYVKLIEASVSQKELDVKLAEFDEAHALRAAICLARHRYELHCLLEQEEKVVQLFG
ncbi:hypothetical protein [Vibrio phage vB_pir03]|nr:hypothetical protein [Vibrio phage vB_pir03]